MVYWYVKVVWGQFDLLSLGGVEHVSETAVVCGVPPTSLPLPTRQVLYGPS